MTGVLVARRAAHEAVTGWLAPTYTVVLGGAGLLVAFVGLAAGGTLTAQDFGRTAVSLLTLVGWIVPLAGVIAGAAAAADDGERTLLLVQPISWRSVFLGRVAGTLGAMIAATLLAFGIVGLVIGLLAGWRDATGFLAVGGIAIGLLGVSVPLGAAVGAALGRRLPAVFASLAVWFALAILWDLMAIAAVSVAGGTFGHSWRPALLAAVNPFDALRLLGTLALGGRDATFGAVTAAAEHADLARLPLLFAVAPALWMGLALAAGDRWFRRRER
jgi:ABC-type transport system involved in multi-copper enzyme maturation permease subunit